MSRPSRRAVLTGAAALAAGCTPGSASVPDRDATPSTGGTGDTGTPPLPAGPPPIIYIYVDQLRWDALGCTGNPVVRSPNIDALAAESVLFRACVTNAPSCRAARATMMTGLPVAEHGVWDNFVTPDASQQSHVRELRDRAGYYTMVVGKTHLHDGFGHLADHVDKLRAWGFSDAVELPDPQQYHLESAHSDWLTATTEPGDTDKYQRWGRYILDYTWDSPPPDLEPYRLSTDDHLDSFCGRVVADFVRAWPDEQPLYLQVNFPGPHKPFDPTSEFVAELDPNDPNLPLPVLQPPQEPLPPLTEQWMTSKYEEWTEESARRLRVSYYAKVALVDRALGEVIAALRDAGLYDRAWIVFHSDHGELLADHMLTGKVLAYEGSVRVPLIIKPPGGVASPWVDEGQVDQLDVTATLLALGGVDPAGFGDRVLIERVLGGPSGPLAHATKPVLFENLGMVGLRTEDFKMSWDLESGRPVELYDLRVDPEERQNRLTDPALRPDLQALVDILRGRRDLPVDTFG
jgi:arylsulfatase